MNPQPPSVRFVGLFLERGGRDEFRISPLCADCGKIIHDVAEANVAVVGDDNFKMTPVGTYLGAKVTRVGGYAQVFCWACDKKRNNVPWTNAAQVFRDRDDPAHQRGLRRVTKRKRSLGVVR